MSGEARAFGTLDGLRGVAALTVFLYHADELVGPLRLPGGYLAVDLFFLLSGFVLEHAYGSRFARGMRPAQFMRARVARLYPLYALGLSLGIAAAVAALALHRGAFDLHRIFGIAVLSALLLPSHAPVAGGFLFVFNSPAWSLFFELLVNLAFALAWRRLTRRVLVAVIVIAGMALAAAVLAEGSANIGWNWPTLACGMPRVTFSFFLGVLLRRLDLGTACPHVAAVLLPLMLVPLFALAPGGRTRAVLDLLCIVLLFPALIAAAVRLQPATERAATVFRRAGWLSFAFYALHYPVIELVLRLGRAAQRPLPAPMAGLATLAVVMLLSWAAAGLYDGPLQRASCWMSPRGARAGYVPARRTLD